MVGFCEIHQVQMAEREGKYGPFWSHKLPEGTWCNGKPREGYTKKETIQAVVDQEGAYKPLSRKEWDVKSFEKSFSIFTTKARADDIHPVDAFKTMHIEEWLYTLHGDEEGFTEWMESIKDRLALIHNRKRTDERES